MASDEFPSGSLPPRRTPPRTWGDLAEAVHSILWDHPERARRLETIRLLVERWAAEYRQGWDDSEKSRLAYLSREEVRNHLAENWAEHLDALEENRRWYLPEAVNALPFLPLPALPLPVPDRQLPALDEVVALVAIHEALWRGGKIIPKPGPDDWTGLADWIGGPFRQLIEQAERLAGCHQPGNESDANLRFVASWLGDLEKTLLETCPAGGGEQRVDNPEPPTPAETNRSGGAEAGQGGKPTNQPAASLLASWREILIALALKNSREDKQKVSRLNKSYGGPIAISGQGGQPLVDKAKLLDWWAGLEAKAKERQQRKQDAQAAVASRHSFGRRGEVVPEIKGEVKRRRMDRRP